MNFFKALLNNNIEDIKKSIAEEGVDINAQVAGTAFVTQLNLDGFTPLALATISSQDLDALKLLLEKGANPNQRSHPLDSHSVRFFGWTPLCLSASYNQVDHTKLLIEYGANPNPEHEYIPTPLYLAQRLGHSDVVELLTNAQNMKLLTNGENIKSNDVSASTFFSAYLGGKLLIAPCLHIYNDYISGKNADKSTLSYFFDCMNIKDAIGSVSFSIVYHIIPDSLSMASRVAISKIASDFLVGCTELSIDYASSVSKTVAYSFMYFALQASQPSLYKDHQAEITLATAVWDDFIDSTVYTYKWMMDTTNNEVVEV